MSCKREDLNSNLQHAHKIRAYSTNICIPNATRLRGQRQENPWKHIPVSLADKEKNNKGTLKHVRRQGSMLKVILFDQHMHHAHMTTFTHIHVGEYAFKGGIKIC